MAKLKAVGVKNLRALVDTNLVALKPITLLVGKNSAGKSTFARIFPLMRQSNEEKRRAPVLWWGKYVDFGAFNDAVYRNAENKEISLCFEMAIDKQVDQGIAFEEYWSDPINLISPAAVRLEVVLGCSSDGDTYVRRTLVTACGINCEVHTTPSHRVTKITCGSILWEPESDVLAHIAAGELLPVVKFSRLIKAKDGRTYVRNIVPLQVLFYEEVRKLFHGNTTHAKLIQIANQIPFGDADDVLDEIKNINGPSSWKKSIAKLTVDDPQFDALRRRAFIRILPDLLRFLNSEIRAFSRGVRYLEPLRATAQRYYRTQELAVDEIDSKGGNLAVFIHSMERSRRARFNDWLEAHMGFQVVPVREGGHISLRVKYRNEEGETNLADTGFGMSQVLPIATQLWSSLDRRIRSSNENTTTCFVIEQPELHLHPAFQEQLADLFVAAISNNGMDGGEPVQIIAETHSSSLINRLGELVANGTVKREDVQIVMFDQGSALSPVTIRTSEFDDDGVLQNWPFGFFSSGRME